MGIRCHKCGKIIDVGSNITSASGGKRHSKYYHTTCFKRMLNYDGK